MFNLLFICSFFLAEMGKANEEMINFVENIKHAKENG